MKTFMTALLTVSVSAALLSLVLFGVRFVMKKAGAPKKWIAALWALLALRLAVPVTVPLSFSPVPNVPETLLSVEAAAESGRETVPAPGEAPAGSPQGVKPAEGSPAEGVDTVPGTLQPASPNAPEEGAFASTAPAGKAKSAPDLYTVLAAVYASGVLALLAYFAISFLRLKKSVREAIPLEGEPDVFLSDRIRTAFVLGPLRRRIYLPIDTSDAYRTDVLLHERTHVKRGDPLWKSAGFLLLALHWFDPLLWVSYFLFVRDIELACDEAAVRALDEDGKRRYARTLLFFGKGTSHPALCRVAFGETGLKERTRALVSERKHRAAVSVLSVILAVAVTACLFTNCTPGNGTAWREGPVPQLRKLSDLAETETPVRVYRLDPEGYRQKFEVADHELIQYLGTTEEAYVFTAYKNGENYYSIHALFLSREDGAVLKDVSFTDETLPYSTNTWYGVFNGRPLVNQFALQAISYLGKPRSRRIGFLNDDGTLDVLLEYMEPFAAMPSVLFLGITGNKLLYTETGADDPVIPKDADDPDEILNARGSLVLKMLDLETGKTDVIRTEADDYTISSFLSGANEELKTALIRRLNDAGRKLYQPAVFFSEPVTDDPKGFFYTVETDLADPEPVTASLDRTENRTLYYYSFEDGASSPVLSADVRRQWGPGYPAQDVDVHVTGDPLWHSAYGDLNVLFVTEPSPAGSVSSVTGLHAVDLQKGTLSRIVLPGGADELTGVSRYTLRGVERTGESEYLVQTRESVLEYDAGKNVCSLYEMPDPAEGGEPYLWLRIADPAKKTVLRFEKDAVFIYDMNGAKLVQEP